MDAERYIALVEERARGGDALAAVEAASLVRVELSDTADAVIEHYVLAARGAGHSWTVIGDRLGVSKQAARQRFGDRSMTVLGGDLKVMPRLQACLDQARLAAEAGGGAQVGTQHLLLGLLHAGVGAAALDRLGVTRERLREASRRLFDDGDGSSVPGERPWSAEAAQAVENARDHARQRGHNYVGTEHLLFVISADPGSQARRVLQDLGVGFAAVKRELEDVLCAAPAGWRSRRRRRAGDAATACSFCGRAKPGVPMVAGPGVCVCADCVRLAVEKLS
ncbi:Clp protease N-terminal domain-containing protein [Actinokineospora sp.]|uniref:ClpX C4-type zinc finger protein n=1 Tax=Actinokineospora sp. TaxID=1872133 RepID=UPI003D6B5B46